MPDINRDISIEQVDYNIDIEQANYTIEINPTSTFEIQLNEQGPQGARGYTGNGIESYELTSTVGLTDTYTITFTDGNTTTVDVTNGRGITSITGPVSVDNVDTYTINYNDNTTSTFNVTNGIDGVNPTVTVGTTTTGNPGTNASVINSGTVQDVILDFTIPRGDKGETGEDGTDGFSPIATVSKVGDTATISITDVNGTTTATITDGTDGTNGQDGQAATIAVGNVTTGLPTDPASVTNVGTSSAAIFDFTIPQGEKGDTGSTGNGVVNTEYISSSGLVDTYHINYTNGSYDSFTVTNGQNGSGSVADVLVNGTSVLDGQDAKILIKTINSNSITGSGNLDVGTVTSVNSVSPVSGDVTLTASDVGALPDSTKYGADLSYSSNTLQLLDQDGNDLGSSVTIQSSPDIDNKSITTNISDELQTIGVIDQNNTTNAIKTWTGTKTQYDAILSKDATTLYNIVDDTDVTLTLLEALYPIGSIYIGTMDVCPMAVLMPNTVWELKAQDRVLQGAGNRGVVGSEITESLPNIWYSNGGYTSDPVIDGALTSISRWDIFQNESSSSTRYIQNYSFSASNCSSTYQDNAPVQQDAYLVNIWERVS